MADVNLSMLAFSCSRVSFWYMIGWYPSYRCTYKSEYVEHQDYEHVLITRVKESIWLDEWNTVNTWTSLICNMKVRALYLKYQQAFKSTVMHNIGHKHHRTQNHAPFLYKTNHMIRLIYTNLIESWTLILLVMSNQ